MSLPQRLLRAYARLVVGRPLTVLLSLVALGALATWGSLQLTINTNQLDLISQDLRQVKDVVRIVDMVGGTGFLTMAVRSEDEAELKAAADDIAEILRADKENVRAVTYKVPVEFIQQNMVLFIRTEDLVEGKNRINAYLKDQLRRANPFFIEIKKTEPVKLELQDLVDKYSRIGKKSILDDYYISNDRKMILLLVKPMWNSPELGKTDAYLQALNARLAEYSANNPRGIQLVEHYQQMGQTGTVTYGYTGSYKTILDDSQAVKRSLGPTTWVAAAGILLVMVIFVRKAFPIVVIASGTGLGTLLAVGFAWLTVGELNMITSMLGAILMGLGVDFGFHFTYRARLELGKGQRYDQALQEAMVHAGLPAFISAIATSGAFFALLFSGFRGFSQFGLLAGCGTFIIGLTVFSWTPAVLSLLGRWKPELPARLIGSTAPHQTNDAQGKALRIPAPKVMIGVVGTLVAVLAVFALPLSEVELPRGHKPTLTERLKAGVRFNYDSRTLMPEDQPSVVLQDEINVRFNISSDPIAVYTRTVEEAKQVWDEFTPLDPQKYSTVDQVVSVYTFVPPPETALPNAKVLAQWQEELKELEVEALPPEVQEKAALFKTILGVKPFGVDEVPQIYRSQFTHLPTTAPENHGWLTFIYPQVDLWDGKNMLKFAEENEQITTADGSTFYAAGLPILYATLAKIVLFDGKLTVALTALWILAVLLLDFRSIKVALASLIPLALGMGLMLGVMALLDVRLNFMNICVLPIVLGYGVSHGVYLVHRYQEGTSPVVALRSVGVAVATSTLTTVAGFGALLSASHNGLKSLGMVAGLGLVCTLVASFALLGPVLQLMHDRREKDRAAAPTEGATQRAA
jgi:uncharacterized protein